GGGGGSFGPVPMDRPGEKAELGIRLQMEKMRGFEQQLREYKEAMGKYQEHLRDVPQMSTVTVKEALELGLERQKAGRMDEAEAIYREVLAQHPHEADALNLLGALAAQTGHPQSLPVGPGKPEKPEKPEKPVKPADILRELRPGGAAAIEMDRA